MADAVRETDNTRDLPGRRAPLVVGGHDYGSLTDTVAAVWEAPRLVRRHDVRGRPAAHARGDDRLPGA